MTDFERAIVNSYNSFFESDDNDFNGIAHRKKQHRYTSQLADVISDSSYPCLYQAIECKSLKADKNNKLYFSQHFSENDEGHQVERMTDFVERSGRQGYLALELKRGRGKPKKAFMIKWPILKQFYDSEHAGIKLDDLSDHAFELKREGAEYKITPQYVAWLQKNHSEYTLSI